MISRNWRKVCAALAISVLMIALSGTVEAAPAYVTTPELYTNQQECDINIEYPIVSRLPNDTVQTQINSIIHGRMVSVMPEKGLSWQGTYSIQRIDENVLSISHGVNRYLRGTPYPVRELRGVTFDMATGMPVELKDIVVVDDEFVAEVMQGEFKAVSPKVREGIRITPDRLMSDSAGKNFYLTNDKMVIIVDVNHAMGDYVSFEVPYSDIADKIKREHPIWKQIVNK